VEKPFEAQEYPFEVTLAGTSRVETPAPEPAAGEVGEVVDLMTALRESVERTKKPTQPPSKRKAS